MSLSPSDYAAWWGAFMATVIGLWDVYKWWRDRPGFIVKVDCPSERDLEKSGNFLSVEIEVINGQSPLTIRQISLRHYKSIWHRPFFKPDRSCKLKQTDLPKKLDPAEVYKVILDECDNDYCLIREDLINGILLIDLYGTHRARPITARLLMKRDKRNKSISRGAMLLC